MKVGAGYSDPFEVSRGLIKARAHFVSCVTLAVHQDCGKVKVRKCAIVGIGKTPTVQVAEGQYHFGHK